MKDIRDIIIMGRLHFSFGGFLLYALGYLLAGTPLSSDRFFYGYLILFLAHLSVSYSNEYYDAKEDRNSKPTMFSGGSGVLVRRPELGPIAKKIALSLIAFSFLAALAYIHFYNFSPMLLLYVLLGNICGWYYSAPPLRLSHRLLGNTVFALTICLLVPGFGNYIASGTITSGMARFAIPLLFYGYAFTIGVEVPDIEADRRNNKRNFASVYGEQASYRTIAALCVLATAAIYAIFGAGETLLFSLAPLAASLYGLAAKKQTTEKKITLIISSIFLFTALCDAFLAMDYL